MAQNDRHPGLVKYRAARAAKKEAALTKKEAALTEMKVQEIAAEIATRHPDRTLGHCVAIARASLKSQSKVDAVRNKNKDKRRKYNNKPDRPKREACQAYDPRMPSPLKLALQKVM